MSRIRIMLAGVLVAAVAGASLANAPSLVNYQGIVTDQSGTPLDGQYTLTFYIYADSAGMESAWSERHYNVPIDQGLFNVILGTVSPLTQDVFDGPERWMGVRVGNDPTMVPMMRITSQPYALRAAYADSAFVSGGGGGGGGWVISGDDLYSAVSGNVGIGTSDPSQKLQVGDNTIPNAQGMIRLASRSGTQGSNRIWDVGVPETDGVSTGIGYSFIVDDTQSGSNPEFMVKWGTGYVAAGTIDPDAHLHVVKPVDSDANATLHLQTNHRVDMFTIHTDLEFEDASINATNSFGSAAINLNDENTGNVLLANGGGRVGIGTTSPDTKLEVVGVARVSALEISGADLAERFPVDAPVEPGMTVSIDPERPGHLVLSNRPYDRCVAGVVSGAGDLAAGAVLGIDTAREEASATVAMSGRVWVRCDAGPEAIAPGDLLTTSATPGHAMKVLDHERARGAMIGKAMSALPAGRGLVLVLVGLQ